MKITSNLNIDTVRRFWYTCQDKSFDKKYGILTSHLKILDQIPNVETQKSIKGGHSKGYQACYVRNIREAIRESLRILPSATAFIDIGSGLGKALFVAREFPQLKSIIGLEYLADLHALAEKNVSSYKESGIQLVNGDANNFIIESQPTILFLFNPFDDVVMKNFVRKNITTIKASKTVIAYVNDVHEDVLNQFDLRKLYENKLRKISIWQ